MCTFLFGGPTLFGHPFNLIREPLIDETSDLPTARLQNYTMIFHTFVLMNIANKFNCRLLPNDEEPKYWVFADMHKNWWFLIVVLIELNIQYAIVSYPVSRTIFGCTTLTPAMHVTAFVLALGSLGIAALTKKVRLT
jgi:hypothetical protein